MPYIKVINGVMQEFNAAGVNTGKVSGIGLNAHAYLEHRQWSVNAPLAPDPKTPDYSTDAAHALLRREEDLAIPAWTPVDHAVFRAL